MITPLDSYFADQAVRPRTHAELRADDARSAEFIAGISRGPAALTRLLGRRGLRGVPARDVAGGHVSS